ncbi:MAG: ABC transporter ATP-binding protein [Deltaproteobacteria bacterium]|jgi:heme exporter protein A|nr:ABC transporter ATP-binding protein [Deltaproteobacteria bacterium]
MAIEIAGLVKRFGPLRAVDGIDLVVPDGSFQVLYGPNGAGKTTLLKILAGLSRPTSGQVKVAGEDLVAHPDRLRGRIGFLTHSPYLYGDLTAEENLQLYADLYGIPDPGHRIEEVLGEVGLSGRARDRVCTYSRGMTQRASIARALLHRPDVLLLDEPFSGLDPEAADHLQTLLEGLRDGARSMVLITHDIARGLALADAIAIQSRGRIVWRSTRAGLNAEELGSIYRRCVAEGRPGTGWS